MYSQQPKVKEEITKEIRKYLEVNENKNKTVRLRECSKSSVQKEIFTIYAYIKKKKDLKLVT